MRIIISTLLISLWSCTIKAQVVLPSVFTDHMVLQRNINIPIWGTASVGTQITVELGGTRVVTEVGQSGKWTIRLPQMQAGGPYELFIFEEDNPKPTIQFQDVMIGDVWIASGQSNMEWQVQQSMNASDEIKNANYPNIRLFRVPHKKTLEPEEDFPVSQVFQYEFEHNKTPQSKEDLTGGAWSVCDSNSVKEASAVAYFFARELHQDLNIPIGILQSTWGGTPIEAWTSREMLLSSPVSREAVLQNDTITTGHFVKDSLDVVRFWDIVYNPQSKTDKTIPKPSFNDSKWPEFTMPSTFKDWNMPDYQGLVWMRKTIELPQSMMGKDLTIELGHPEMNYTLYFNGAEICKNVWNSNKTHHYILPGKLIKKGENVVAVRMAVLWGSGGFNPPANLMYITDSEAKISIAGQWKYMKDLEPRVPTIRNYHQFPTYLYNGMIYPIIPYGIKGFIWYQGENNTSNTRDYRTSFPMLMNDWRIRWQQGYLPFLYVQLANFMPVQPDPGESDWAELREAQTMTLSQPNTGMACIIDIGEADNIHPKNKQEVGHRLALIAKNQVYEKDVIAYGPMYKSHQITRKEIRIQFCEIGSGLTFDDEKIKGFAVSGEDRKFYWAEAKIVGDEVVVSSEKVGKPVAVRYSWADNSECNLMNKEGFPAIPFRTDDWKGITQK